MLVVVISLLNLPPLRLRPSSGSSAATSGGAAAGVTALLPASRAFPSSLPPLCFQALRHRAVCKATCWLCAAAMFSRMDQARAVLREVVSNDIVQVEAPLRLDSVRATLHACLEELDAENGAALLRPWLSRPSWVSLCVLLHNRGLLTCLPPTLPVLAHISRAPSRTEIRR